MTPEVGWTASLPWYDLEEVRWATDALWNAIADKLRHSGFTRVPDTLDRVTHFETQWRSGNLLLSQACGYDVVLAHRNHLQLVATPTYSAPGCGHGLYSSYVLVRSESPFHTLSDLRGARCVINTCTSHSGMNILRSIVAPLHEEGRFFRSVDVSGSHERSIERLRTGHADVAAIDCVTYALICRNRPEELAGLRILRRTARMPAPPFVTSARTPADAASRLRLALMQTLQDPALQDVKAALLLDSVSVVPISAYNAIAECESAALSAGLREFL